MNDTNGLTENIKDENYVIRCPNSLDEITLFGSEAQAGLERISASMAESVIADRDIESFIEEYIADLEENAAFAENERGDPLKRLPFLGKTRSRRDYQSALDGLDRLKIILQLEQAKQIKQIHVMNRLETLAQDCCSDFETVIQAGNTVMKHSGCHSRPDAEVFLDRFRQRMDSLNISSVVALQTLGQIRLLQQTSVSLADKLQDAVMHLIPLWRNQISLLYGMHKTKKDSKVIRQEIRQGLRGEDGNAVQRLSDLDRTIVSFLKDIQKSYKKISENNTTTPDIKETTNDRKGEKDEQ